jgi:ATP-dependent DNA helicase RecQ
VLEGRDLLAVMPTGSGKSLGFQLPALLLPGLTLVVSPLISLMKDQVDELNRRGVAAGALHSQVTAEARRSALRAARLGELRLLYVAPERFASDFFAGFLRELTVSRFVVDEAHCVSEWGHDFRPDYRRLRDAAEQCRRSDGGTRPPMAAFTATATPEVRADIVELLGLSNPRVVVAGFDRPNITLRVQPVSGDEEKHHLLPQLVPTGRALVYASTRRKAEDAASTLRIAGRSAAAYHAGLTDAERTRVQDGFAGDAFAVVCATNAFGMGIDRPDVEAVVHIDIPGSIEAYYQEIGRAGRDGRQATATLLWNYADVKTREFLIDRGRDDLPDRARVVDPGELAQRKALEHKKLRRMVAYADSAGCLRSTILRYFGDPAAPPACGSCGNCARRSSVDDDTLLMLRKILSGIARAGERYGRRRITAMLVGTTEDLPEALRELSTTGLLRKEPPKVVEGWIDAACGGGLIDVSNDEYRILRLTPLGRDVMTGRVTDVAVAAPLVRAAGRAGRSRRRKMRAEVHASPHAVRTVELHAGTVGSEDPAPAAVEALRTWRREEARRRAVPPYVILHDRTLLAIAAVMPHSTAALVGISGIGPAKMAEYGDAIVAVVASARGRS